MAEEMQAVAKYDYKAADERELDIRKNEKLVILDRTGNWWRVQNTLGRSGYVPSNYLKTLKPSIFSSLKRIIRKSSRGEGDGLQLTASSQNGSDTLSSLGLSDLTLNDAFTAVARYAYEAQKQDEVSLSRGDTIVVYQKSSDGWWLGRHLSTGQTGWFPSNYVEVHTGSSIDSISSPTPDNSFRRRKPAAVPRQAVALYRFDAKNEDELSFDENERLDILDNGSPTDAGWLRAQNACGNVGLVPQDFLRIISTGDDSDSPPSGAVGNTASGGSLSNSSAGRGSLGAERSSSGISLSGASRNGSAPFANRDWYFGNITRAECEDAMNQYAEDGDFLIRESETNVGDYTLSMKTPNRMKHFRIVADCTGCYRIGPMSFQQMDELVEHYKKHAIYRLGSEKLFLTKPFTRSRPNRTAQDGLAVSPGLRSSKNTSSDNMYDM